MTIKVYSAPEGVKCQQCLAVIRHLENRNIPFEKLDGSLHKDYLMGLGGYRQVPVIVCGDQHFYGYDIGKLQQLTA